MVENILIVFAVPVGLFLAIVMLGVPVIAAFKVVDTLIGKLFKKNGVLDL